MTLSTVNSNSVQTGTNWTMDVTPCNLDPDLTVKDYRMVITISGVPTVIPNSQTNKLTPNSIQYVGAAVPANSPVVVARQTPRDPRVTVGYKTILSSQDYNKELERIARRAYEYDLNGVGPVVVINPPQILNTVYGPSWDNDISNGPSRNAVYDKFVLVDNEAASQNTRITNIETLNLGPRMSSVEAVNATQDNNILALQNRPGTLRMSWNALVYNNASGSGQTPNNSPSTIISFNTLNGWGSVVTGPAQFTVPAGQQGFYAVIFDAGIGAYSGSNNPTNVALELNVNGVNQVRWLWGRAFRSSNVGTFFFGAGDVVQARYISDTTGGTITVNILQISLFRV